MAGSEGDDEEEPDRVVVERNFGGGLILAIALVVLALVAAHMFGLLPT